MPIQCDSYKLIGKTAIAENIFSFEIHCPEVAKEAKCGQFVHILVQGKTLRRPISICEVNREKGTLRVVFEIRGAGTDQLSTLNVGDEINMIAPLGNGFTVRELPENKRVIVVGGGIGVPPMLETAKAHKKAVAILGFRSFDRVILKRDFEANGIETTICTDDGSVGYHGLVSDPLSAELEKGGVDAVFACGPKPMLAAVMKLAKQHNIFCEISLEERMACGVGACVGCVCRINRGGEEKLLRVCKDGPVFNAEEVIL